jgi:hypothetical protein
VIKDTTARNSILEQWKTVRLYQAMMQTNTLGGFVVGAIYSPDFLNGCDTLVLVFAFSVFERALRSLYKEKVFAAEATAGVKGLMLASRASLPWVNFSLVDQAREERQQAAHGVKIVPREDSLRYVDAMEAELVAWGVLDGPITGEYTIQRGKVE